MILRLGFNEKGGTGGTEECWNLQTLQIDPDGLHMQIIKTDLRKYSYKQESGQRGPHGQT